MSSSKREVSVYKILKMIMVLSLALTVSCGGSGDSRKNKNANEGNGVRDPGQTQVMPVNWDSISNEFNPEIIEEEFSTTNLSFVKLGVIGISNEVNVSFSNKLSSIGKLKIYRVWNNSANFGQIELNTSFDKLQVENYTGNQPYRCTHVIRNRQLVSVDGGCNLFIEVILPTSSEIEVYSGDKLLSKRFFPMSFDKLIKEISSGFNNEKLEVVENFIASYRQTGKKLKLSSLELEEILKEFTFTNVDKFSALRKLHVHVIDRENLNKVIENTFSFSSDQEKARRIVGI